MSEMLARWRYERGEGRFKHRWPYDYAGFEPSGRGPVGKCPRHVTPAIAEEVLNTTAASIVTPAKRVDGMRSQAILA